MARLLYLTLTIIIIRLISLYKVKIQHPLTSAIIRLAQISNLSSCWFNTQQNHTSPGLTLTVFPLTLRVIANTTARYSGFDYNLYTETKPDDIGGRPRPINPTWEKRENGSQFVEVSCKAPFLAYKAPSSQKL